MIDYLRRELNCLKIGYIKNFETIDERDAQIEYMTKLGVSRIVLEVESNVLQGRQSLIDSINSIGKSDVLVVRRLDDLGDSLPDIIDTLKRLETRKIDLECIDLPNLYKDVNDIKIKRLLQKQLLSILSWVECKERDDIARMQANAVRVLKELKSQKGSGRPKKYAVNAKDSKDREIYFQAVKMLENNIPIKRIAEKLNISRNTIYSIKKDIEKTTP